MFVSHQYNTYKILDESHKQSSDAYNQKYHLANVTSSTSTPTIVCTGMSSLKIYFSQKMALLNFAILDGRENQVNFLFISQLIFKCKLYFN